MILRTAEIFETGVVIYDAHDVMKSDALERIADFACGALGHRPPFASRDPDQCLARVSGRIAATRLGANAKPLPLHTREDNDCSVLGNEYDGVPEQFAVRTTGTIWAPTTDQRLPKPKSTYTPSIRPEPNVFGTMETPASM